MIKKLIFAVVLIFSTSILGGCSKDDDGPSSSGSVEGNVKVDGKKINLNYGYVIYDYDDAEYYFYDKDILKYLDEDGDIEETDFEHSGLYLEYDGDISKVTELYIDYKVNYYREKGYFYESIGYNAYESLSFSHKNRKVTSSCKSIQVVGYDFDDNNLGRFDASYSVGGSIMDIMDYIEDYGSNSRSIEVLEVTDSKQISFLKSLKMKHDFLRKME